MDKYRVKINPRAIRELDQIYKYIALAKLSPENAKGQTDRIKAAILDLDTFPEAHQERQEGRYAGKGYRQLLIDNYLAIFRIDKKKKVVTVITIQYQGRNTCPSLLRPSQLTSTISRFVLKYIALETLLFSRYWFSSRFPSTCFLR
ncbi:MAG: type II toxin-antitoxin system RelE/ParE family toxin [Lachnospiraceae bacterium]|nr:type II toxin-antitoxin system RelE/ParE family toxin [Lachnospiraceae bacterium]